jgi:hypothetical protein
MELPLVHSLFLAEFDIDKGSVLKHRYPPGSLSDIPDDWFSDIQVIELNDAS